MISFIFFWALVVFALLLVLAMCAVAVFDVSQAAREERHRVY